jgi:hypothetical protein
MLTTDIKPGDNETYGPVRLYRPQDGTGLLLFLDWSTGHSSAERERGWNQALRRATGLGFQLACESPRSTIADVESYQLVPSVE